MISLLLDLSVEWGYISPECLDSFYPVRRYSTPNKCGLGLEEPNDPPYCHRPLPTHKYLTVVEAAVPVYMFVLSLWWK